MNDLETLRFELADNVARVTFNRPDAANAMNLQMAKDLLEVGIECDENPEVRAVLLRSVGRMFCAGGDLASFAKAGAALPRGLKEMTVYLHAAITRLTRGSAPVIAAVQGPAAGAGFSVACAARVADGVRVAGNRQRRAHGRRRGGHRGLLREAPGDLPRPLRPFPC